MAITARPQAQPPPTQTTPQEQTTIRNEITSFIFNKKVSDLEAAILKIKPGLLRPTSWNSFLNDIYKRWSDPEDTELQRKLIRLLLSHGGKRNENTRRLLLDIEIQKVGDLPVDPNQLDDSDKVALIIAEEALESFPDLAWSSALNTKRTVFHTAAEAGAHQIILLAEKTLQKEGKTLEGTGISISSIIRQSEVNDRTALELAVENRRELAVDELLRLDESQLDDNPNAGRIITSAVEGGMTSIVKALVKNRFGLLTEELFRKAIGSTKVPPSTKLEILEFLIDSIPGGSSLLRESTFLHHAVRKGQVKIVELLIKRCPSLTTRYERETTPNPKDRSVLYYNNTPDARDAIRDLIVPVIIERNPISVIRELFADTSEKRKEVCLDLSALTYDGGGLDRFVLLVKSDLAAARPKSDLSDDIIMKVIKSLPSGQRDILEPFYKSFLAQPAAVKNLNALPAIEPMSQGRSGSGEPSQSTLPIQDLYGSSYSSPDPTSDLSDNSSVFELQFERTLKYVELPAFDPMKATCREEARDILNWLGECKGVTKIFELRVTDSLYQPHSEEVIEDALKRFDVENLNWRRTDLSINTVQEAAPNVKRLSLYCSGNQAILEHWIGDNGISSLGKNLEFVHITILEDSISSARAKAYKVRAQEKLAALREGDQKWFKVECGHWYPKESKEGGNTSKTNLLKPAAITQLSYFLPKYKEFQWTRRSERSTRIKIAILDSGVDRGLFTGLDRNVTGASFVHKHGGSKESPWWLPSDLHGSHIANLISQIDPCCDFYVAKVTETKKDLDLSRVVQAIRWAIDQKVDIINLSLVLFVYDQDLRDAIVAANAAGILIICSTADQGYIRQDVWPAKYSNSTSNEFPCIIPIVACNAHGKPTEYSSEIDAHYIFQGEDVISSSAEGPFNETQSRVSGSSVATAIATGVASLVLACHRILQEAPLERRRQGLSSNSSVIIRNVFAKMCREQVKAKAKKPWYVKPWGVFPARDKNDRSVDPTDYTLGEADDVLEWILDVFPNALVEP